MSKIPVPVNLQKLLEPIPNRAFRRDLQLQLQQMSHLPELEDLGIFLLVNPQGVESQQYVDALVSALTQVYKTGKLLVQKALLVNLPELEKFFRKQTITSSSSSEDSDNGEYSTSSPQKDAPKRKPAPTPKQFKSLIVSVKEQPEVQNQVKETPKRKLFQKKTRPEYSSESTSVAEARRKHKKIIRTPKPPQNEITAFEAAAPQQVQQIQQKAAPLRQERQKSSQQIMNQERQTVSQILRLLQQPMKPELLFAPNQQAQSSPKVQTVHNSDITFFGEMVHPLRFNYQSNLPNGLKKMRQIAADSIKQSNTELLIRPPTVLPETFDKDQECRGNLCNSLKAVDILQSENPKFSVFSTFSQGCRAHLMQFREQCAQGFETDQVRLQLKSGVLVAQERIEEGRFLTTCVGTYHLTDEFLCSLCLVIQRKRAEAPRHVRQLQQQLFNYDRVLIECSLPSIFRRIELTGDASAVNCCVKHVMECGQVVLAVFASKQILEGEKLFLSDEHLWIHKEAEILQDFKKAEEKQIVLGTNVNATQAQQGNHLSFSYQTINRPLYQPTALRLELQDATTYQLDKVYQDFKNISSERAPASYLPPSSKLSSGSHQFVQLFGVLYSNLKDYLPNYQNLQISVQDMTQLRQFIFDNVSLDQFGYDGDQFWHHDSGDIEMSNKLTTRQQTKQNFIDQELRNTICTYLEAGLECERRQVFVNELQFEQDCRLIDVLKW